MIRSKMTRPGFIAGSAAATTVLSFGAPSIAAERTIKLGYVSPQTGPLAPSARPTSSCWRRPVRSSRTV